MSKSFVRRECKTCMVCAKKVPTGALLVTKNPKVRTQWGMCPQHKKLRDRNLIAMVEVDPAKSLTVVGEDLPEGWQKAMSPDNAHRTGVVVYVARSVFNEIFYGEAPENGVCFVPPEITATLQLIEHYLHSTQTQH